MCWGSAFYEFYSCRLEVWSDAWHGSDLSCGNPAFLFAQKGKKIDADHRKVKSRKLSCLFLLPILHCGSFQWLSGSYITYINERKLQNSSTSSLSSLHQSMPWLKKSRAVKTAFRGNLAKTKRLFLPRMDTKIVMHSHIAQLSYLSEFM